MHMLPLTFPRTGDARLILILPLSMVLMVLDLVAFPMKTTLCVLCFNGRVRGTRSPTGIWNVRRLFSP